MFILFPPWHTMGKGEGMFLLTATVLKVLQRHLQKGEEEVIGLKLRFFFYYRSRTSEAEEIILAQGINTSSYILARFHSSKQL